MNILTFQTENTGSFFLHLQRRHISKIQISTGQSVKCIIIIECKTVFGLLFAFISSRGQVEAAGFCYWNFLWNTLDPKVSRLPEHFHIKYVLVWDTSSNFEQPIFILDVLYVDTSEKVVALSLFQRNDLWSGEAIKNKSSGAAEKCGGSIKQHWAVNKKPFFFLFVLWTKETSNT